MIQRSALKQIECMLSSQPKRGNLLILIPFKKNGMRMDLQNWQVLHGASTPTLQTLASTLHAQPSSSSCCRRIWGTYSFVHSVQRHKTTLRVTDSIFSHSQLWILSRRNPQYWQRGEQEVANCERLIHLITPRCLRFKLLS